MEQIPSQSQHIPTQRQQRIGTVPLIRDKGTRIAIDLTPLLPGGDNGGAKLVATGLIRQLCQAAPAWEFVLLTLDSSHDELASLDAPNVWRLCIKYHDQGAAPSLSLLTWLRFQLCATLMALLPHPLLKSLKATYRVLLNRPKRNRLPQQIDADLLFCPFTAPFYFDPSVPVVSIVHDLQYVYYPQFFSADECQHRTECFQSACRLSAKLICVSDYVRGTVLENADVYPQHVLTIHTHLFQRLDKAPLQSVVDALKALGLQMGRYLLYPANFWPHKNHRMLLTAFGMFRASHPESDLKLVCTGAPGDNMDSLHDAVRRMRLDAWLRFPGYVPDATFAALLQACHALIFPSLYEGFGMPILEAMAFGKPVLCSNVTSLPEIARDAALFFDPRKPNEIVDAIARIENDTELVMRLIQLGYKRLETIGNAADMTQQYLQVFCDVMMHASRGN